MAAKLFHIKHCRDYTRMKQDEDINHFALSDLAH